MCKILSPRLLPLTASQWGPHTDPGLTVRSSLWGPHTDPGQWGPCSEGLVVRALQWGPCSEGLTRTPVGHSRPCRPAWHHGHLRVGNGIREVALHISWETSRIQGMPNFGFSPLLFPIMMLGQIEVHVDFYWIGSEVDSACKSGCPSVFSWKPCFLVDWRLLVIELISNIV